MLKKEFKMKTLIFIILLAVTIQAKPPLEVISDKFSSNENKHIAVFEGNAKATQGKSWIKAKKFIVYLDKNNSAKEYRAIGDVSFEIIKPKQHIKGVCNLLIYRVKSDSYTLEGNATVDDILNKRKMSADRLFLDNKNSFAKAISKKKGPVKLIFQMDDATGNKKKTDKK
jgi:lipopolysaccharide export system protein LptA